MIAVGFYFVFSDFLWWAGNWVLSTLKYVNQNSLDEGFPYDNLGLARLSVEFNGQR